MSAPVRIQRKRTKGWKMPENTVYVGRPGPYGNPFTIGAALEAGYRGTVHQLAQMCVDEYRRAPGFDDPSFLAPLRGKNLACWCPLDQPCHADVLLERANGLSLPSTERGDAS